MSENSPHLERDGEIAYFTDDEGTRFRVYDVAFGAPLAKPRQRRVVALESP